MKETKEVLEFVISLANSLGESLEDGKISYSDALSLWGPLNKIGDAIEGLNKVAYEIGSMTKEDMDDLIEFAKTELELPQDRVEAMIESALEIGARLLMLVGQFKGN